MSTLRAGKILALAVLVGCGDARESTEMGRVQVVVGITPQRAWVEAIGGDHVAVTVLVAPGQEPETYEPTPRQMVEVVGADLVFTMGMPFERVLVARITADSAAPRVVDLLAGVERLPMPSGHHHLHDDRSHHPAHSAGEPDPHVWLDPVRVQTMAVTLRDALMELAPASAAIFAANHERFDRALAEAHARNLALLKPFQGRQILVFHPAYGYFTHRYGLVQVPIEVAGREPTPRELAAIVERARRLGTRTVFVQREFSTEAARAVADAVGGAAVHLDPLAADFVANLERMALAVAATLGAEQ